MILLAVGIDPGFATCGLGIIRRRNDGRWQHVFSRTVLTPAKEPLHDRMGAVYSVFREELFVAHCHLFSEFAHRQLQVACEEQTGTQEGKRRSGGTNADALRVQQVVGFARVLSFWMGCGFVEPTPAQTKKVLVGIKGNASKEQVQRAVRAVVIGCPEVMSNHASDALANALAGARMVR